ncbi:MAG: diversity-generating retroelement protein Avd [Gammaproteobacteria bacterium]|nr:diversity-generating retroelement protein Avd [Gammaproteobacteria bacterium]
MTQAPGELLVIDRSYELVLWSCRHIAGFPRSHRFTLGERMQQRLYDLLELLLKAKYSGEKRGLLRQANMELELLRFQFRLAKDLECLTLKHYEYGVRAVNEIGRMVGAWLKQSGGKGSERR